ncbi:MAG: peptidylprolyl isomerase [Coriobacteriia bacterium]
MYTPSYVPNGDEVAVIKTNKGEIRVQLFGKDAPVTVGNFVELATKGFYDDVKFHRYVQNFVIQGGDPQTKELPSDRVVALVEGGGWTPGDPRLGTGGPGYSIVAEFQNNPHRHADGALAMARSQHPDSAGSQFYFTLGEQAFLDGNYTVFGQTIEGMDVIASLRVGDVIESITIENMAA